MNKYEDFVNKSLSTMVVEIDLTKTEKNFGELLDLVQQLECAELSDNNLEVKDIYFK